METKSTKKVPPGEKKIHVPIIYLGLLLILMFMFQYYVGTKDEDITYSEFINYLEEGKVLKVFVGPSKIEGYLKEKTTDPKGVYQPVKINGQEVMGRRFTTVRIDDEGLMERLRAANIGFEGRLDSPWVRELLFFLVFPMVIILAFWGFFFRKMGRGGGLMSIGRNKAKVFVEKNPEITFKDVAGIDEVVEEVKEIVEYLKTPEKFSILGGKIPKGVLLVGPPGTGKTLLAKAIAGEAGVPFFSLSGSDFVEMFVGVGAARVRDLFQRAAEIAPSIVFIDEIDALGKARGMSPLSSHDEREQTLNQLLAEMDGFEGNKGVIIMGATNRPEILDLALLRPGRFDRQVVVTPPDIHGREAILKVHSRGVKLADEVDLQVIAARTPGFVGADLANIINEAALLAARKSKPQVTMADFQEAIDRVTTGLERKSRVLNPNEQKVVAYHESGHAIIALMTPNTDPVHRVSIIPRGVAALGYTLQLPTEDRYLMTKSELIARMKVLLGGRVAEETIFKEISTGAQNDLERVTNIARSMVMDFGMSDKLGPLTYRERRAVFLAYEANADTTFSEQTAREIDCEIRSLVEDAHAEVRTLMAKHQQLLHTIAAQLLKEEVIEGVMLKQMVEQYLQATQDSEPVATDPGSEVVN